MAPPPFVPPALLALSFTDWFESPGDGPGLTMWQAYDVTDALVAVALGLVALLAFSAFIRCSIAATMALFTATTTVALIAIIALAIGLISPPEGFDRGPAAFAAMGLALALALCARAGMQDSNRGFGAADPA